MSKKDGPETTSDSTGVFSIKNLPSMEELTEFYQKYYFQDENVRPKSYQSSYNENEIENINLMNDLIFYSIENIKPELKETKKFLLEIGVGEGFTLARALHHGWNVDGVDFGDHGIKKFNPELLSNLQKGNTFEIIEKLVEQKKVYDVCIIKNVLEHTINPNILLDNLKKLMKPEGILVIIVPNDYSKLQLRALELGFVKDKFWLIPPQHLHYFNTENISAFIEKRGFSVLDMYSSFPIDFFLFNQNSYYVIDEASGKLAHQAQIELELLMARDNLENYYHLCQSMAKCHVGRNVTIIVKKDSA